MVEVRNECKIIRVLNIAFDTNLPVFVGYEARKVNLHLVDRGIQLYLDGPLAGILINTVAMASTLKQLSWQGGLTCL